MKIKSKISIALVLVVLLLVGFFYFTKQTTIQRSYSSYEESVSGDPYSDHWIPEILPPTAADIYVQYQVDPSFLRVEFVYDSKDWQVVSSNFTEISDDTIRHTVLEVLQKKSWRTRIPEHVNVLVSKEKDPRYLVVDTAQRRAWYSAE